MSIREKRLAKEYQYMEALQEKTSFIEFKTKGEPPEEYLVKFGCIGMVNPHQQGNEHVIHIYLSAEFPRKPPQVTFLTSIFHPNIIAPIQSQSVQALINRELQNVKDENTRRQIREAILTRTDLYEGQICLDTLSLNWSPSITLDIICLELGEMIQYKRYNPDDPLNSEAAEWSQIHRDQLPLDNRNLCDLEALQKIRIIAEHSYEESGELVKVL